jgi:hypothetical protein
MQLTVQPEDVLAVTTTGPVLPVAVVPLKLKISAHLDDKLPTLPVQLQTEFLSGDSSSHPFAKVLSDVDLAATILLIRRCIIGNDVEPR